MRFLGLDKLPISASASDVCQRVFPRGRGAVGSISLSQAAYLCSAIEAVDAKRVVEIGVASGASSLVMLAMLERMGGKRELFAFDVLTFYYGDPGKPVGYLASESEFNVDDRYLLSYPKFCADARAAIAADGTEPYRTVDLAFVDGSHRHPWATIDLLLLLPLLKIGGIVVFHDINLLALTGTQTDLGPQYLFEQPFANRFVESGSHPNIGSLQVFDFANACESALAALERPWEIEPDSAQRSQIVREASLAASAGLLEHRQLLRLQELLARQT